MRNKEYLMEQYKEWRKLIEENNEFQEEHGGSLPIYASVDCGEARVREDFSNYANLDEEITFEEMLELEKEYEE